MRAPDPEADRLLGLLALERETLVAGKLDRLPQVAAAKAAALERLADRQRPADPALLRRIGQRAEANRRLYEAALTGIRRVRDQVAAMVSGGGAELRTYAADGGRRALAPGGGRVERKA